MLKNRCFSLMKYLIIGIVALSLGCNESSQADRLSKYLSTINSQEVSARAAVPGATALVPGAAAPDTGANAGIVGSANTIVAGTPRQASKDGFCGDGVINGTTEDCDQGAIQNTTCKEYGGIGGVVTCQPNCLYDISDCITPAVDKRIGGTVETCKCNCTSTLCRGGCQSTSLVGQSICRYDCENKCTCRCGGKLEASVEDCEFRCACVVDVAGNPQCECNLDSCEILSGIAPNIGTLLGGPSIGLIK